MKNKTKMLVLSGAFAAVITVCAWIAFPVGEVPINLALLAVLLAGSVLSAKYGAASVLCYILLCAVGVPVLAGMKGGVGALLGATGGYVVGYLPAAVCAAFPLKNQNPALKIAFMALGVLLCYLLGTLWFIHITGRTFYESLGLCVIPFIPGDAAKILLAALLSKKLKKSLRLSGETA